MKSSYRRLRRADARRVPWKNGLGSTLELAADAPEPGGEWTWRLSVADVPSRAPFSAFPGVDRLLACLEGPGLALERAGARSLVPREGEALAFAGEEPAVGEPLGPGVRDANLMLRRDRWRGRMTLVRGRAAAAEAALVLAHVPDGAPALRARSAEGDCEFAPGDTLVAGGRVELSGSSGSVAIVCELSPVRAASARKRCASCGDDFPCGPETSSARCWCEALPPVMPLDDAGCLCERCLRREIAALLARAGLCASCRHAKRLATAGGSTVFLCGLSARDERFPKYPRLPMARCDGHAAPGTPVTRP